MRTPRETDRNKEINKDIDYYFKENRYLVLLRETKKYKELWSSKEAMLSLLITILIITLLLSVYDNSFKNTISLLRTLTITIFAGMFGLLGFIISGVSILSAMISNKIIEQINHDGKITHLIRIIFTFYFVGSLIGVNIVLSALAYISTYTPFELNIPVLVIWSLLLGYLSIFTLVSCIMLLGTSMRFLLLNHFYHVRNKSSKSEDDES